MRIKKELFFSKGFIIFTLILSLLIIGGTYSYFAFTYENDSTIVGNVIGMDMSLDVELIVGDNSGMVPLKDSALNSAINGTGGVSACVDANSNLSCQVYKITLTNNGSPIKDIKGTIELYAKNGGTYTDLKWRELTNPTTVKEGSIVNGMESSLLAKIDKIEHNEVLTYYIAVYIQETDVDQRNSNKGDFGGTVTFETYSDVGTDIIKSSSVMDNISSTYVSSDSGIDFANPSSDTNGKGVYMLSSTKDDLYPIYYYRGAVNNNNVLFANFCWKIVRTTETGGIKLIYNGTQREVVNINSITQDKYTNVTNDSTNPYTYDTDTNKWTSTNHTNSATGTIEFSVSEAGDYYLEYSVSSEADYDYAIFYLDGTEKAKVSGTESGTINLGSINSSNVIKVEYTKDSSSSSENDNVVFSVGTSTGELSMTCDNSGENSQIGTSAFNSSYNSPAYVGYMYGDTYTYSSKSMGSVTDTYYYGADVTYSGGTYTLTNTISSNSWSSIYNGGLNNNHYTCLSTGTTCSSVYYIYYTNSSTAYYITLTNGKKVEDALNEMLTNSSNSTSSTIKTTIDTWYSNNLTSYTDKLEDTVWCNDRSIGELNGWDPNGGSTRSYLYFSPYTRNVTNKTPSLTCTNAVDKFTVDSSKGNKKLTYPVGLLTADEMVLGGTSWDGETWDTYLNSGAWYWSAAPYSFDSAYVSGFGLSTDGDLDYGFVSGSSGGVRPSVSLRPGISFSEGTGTVSDPYVVQ